MQQKQLTEEGFPLNYGLIPWQRRSGGGRALPMAVGVLVVSVPMVACRN